MTTLDRAKQRAILTALQEVYPKEYFAGSMTDADLWSTEDLWYLEEHDLVELKKRVSSSGDQKITIFAARLTAKGMDFLADDGGLSAVLGTVTVRIHEDTLKAIIESKIMEADLPTPEKKRWLDQLRNLPAEATKHLVLKLLDLGLAHAPDALPLLQNTFESIEHLSKTAIP